MFTRLNFPLKPTPEHAAQFVLHAGHCRFVWNKLLEENIEQYKRDGTFKFGLSLVGEVTRLRKEHEFLKDVNSQSLQAAAGNLAAAFKNRFSKKSKRRTEFPKFKSKHGKHSFTVPQHFDIRDGKIKLPKIGWVKMNQHRKIVGVAKSLVIAKNVDEWTVSILCEIPDVAHSEPESIADIVGIDVGIKNFAITSDGEVFNLPTRIKSETKKLKRLQRRHSKKKLGSENRDKARVRVAKQYRRITRIKKDFVCKTASAIAKHYDLAVIEDLNIQGMKKNRRLSRVIQENPWRLFADKLSEKMLVHRVSRWFPSSKICSSCGWNKKDLNLGHRIFECECCGLSIDRDLNAAINLAGASPVTACGGAVRPELVRAGSVEAGIRSSLELQAA